MCCIARLGDGDPGLTHPPSHPPPQLFTFSAPVKTAVQTHPAILWAAIGVSFASLIALSCCPGVAQKSPGNYIALSIFTLAEGYLVGAVASTYNTDAVLIAVGGTVLITLCLTLFAMQTKYDFTAWTSGMLVVLLVLIFFGIVVAISPSQIMRTLYACIGLLVFSVFIVIDVQLVCGRLGAGKLEFSIDDAILGALSLYLDVIQIFMFLLRLVGDRN